MQKIDLDSIPSSRPDVAKHLKRKKPTSEFDRNLESAKQKYSRSERKPSVAEVQKISDRKLKSQVVRAEKKFDLVTSDAARAEILLPAEAGFLKTEGMQRSYKVSQKEIALNVDMQTRKKIFDLKLDEFGPYMMNYSRNGRHLLIGGSKGHVALFNWSTFRLQTELHLKETVRDITFLQNNTLFAVAQKKYVYIYDCNGVELHCLRNHIEPTRLEFLPYHFLLASSSKTGFLKYQDVSTGQLIVELRTKLGPVDALAQNSRNAILSCGHAQGAVTMWSPNMTTPLVKMLCHRGPVLSMAFESMGMYMATSGMDGQVKIWDLRTYKVLEEYNSARPANSLAISQMGLLAVGFGPHIQIWKDSFTTKQQSPYLVHQVSGAEIKDLGFCPYEDILGFAHSDGYGSIVVPGAGEPNFDSFESDIFTSRKQRQETEVRHLLDKLQPEMITLDASFIATVDRASKEQLAVEEKELQQEVQAKRQAAAAASASSDGIVVRGSAKKVRRRRTNIIDTETKRRKEDSLRRKQQEQVAAVAAKVFEANVKTAQTGATPRSALQRFMM